MTTASRAEPASTADVAVDACGTTWRLRSLVAMGHDTARLASALGASRDFIQQILRDDADTVSPAFRDLAVQLWDAWWDKRPPEQTRSERRRATFARHLAEQNDWCPPLGLNEDELDEPGYRPYARYREATGTGTAGEFRPSAIRPSFRPAGRVRTEWISQPSREAITRASLERQQSAKTQTASDTAPASPACATTSGKQPEHRTELAAVLALRPDRVLVRRQSADLRAAVHDAVLSTDHPASQPNPTRAAVQLIAGQNHNFVQRSDSYQPALRALGARIHNAQPRAAPRVGSMASSSSQPAPTGTGATSREVHDPGLQASRGGC